LVVQVGLIDNVILDVRLPSVSVAVPPIHDEERPKVIRNLAAAPTAALFAIYGLRVRYTRMEQTLFPRLVNSTRKKNQVPPPFT